MPRPGPVSVVVPLPAPRKVTNPPPLQNTSPIPVVGFTTENVPGPIFTNNGADALGILVFQIHAKRSCIFSAQSGVVPH